MASGNFISSTGTNLNLYVTWSSVADTSTNTSTVTANVYMRSYTISGSALTNSYISINGNKKSFAGKSLSKTSNSLTDTLLVSHTVSGIAHNTDGTKSITITANLDFNGTVTGKYLDDVTASKTVALDNIPRSSSFTVPSSVNTGSTLTVAITPSSSTFRHQFRFVINGIAKYTSEFVAAGVKTYSYPIPHNWLPSTASQTVTLYCDTYPASGNTAIASVQKTFTANVPANIKPSISKVSTALSGGLDGQYVQGKSQITLTAEASPGSGSTLTSYIFEGANINGTSSSYTGTSNTKKSSTIQSINTVGYTVRAVDARGRQSDPYKVSITVHRYSNPKINSISAQRCLQDGTLDDNGTYVQVVATYSYESVGGANTKTITLYNNIVGSQESASATVVSTTDDTASKQYTCIYGGNFELTQSYEIQAVITDRYNTGTSLSKSTTIETATRTLNIARYGNGVAVGGLSSVTSPDDAGKFESNWDAYFNDSLYVTNKITCNNPYDARNFNINCYWKDGNTHDILVRNIDGLTVGLGWVGNTTYPTVLNIRPTQTNIQGTMQCYVNGELTLRTGKDETSEFIQSLPTYNRTYAASPNMYITNLGTLGRGTSSSERYKTEIEDVKDDSLNPYNVLNIPVRQFKYNEDNTPIDREPDDLYIGFIAEEVAQAYPAAAEYNEDGQVEMWNIKTIVPAMLKIIQDQQKAINELKQKVDELEMKN